MIDWINFKDQQPPDTVEYYLTRNDDGYYEVFEWFEGDYFACSSGGHWQNYEGEEITNITHWAVINPVE